MIRSERPSRGLFALASSLFVGLSTSACALAGGAPPPEPVEPGPETRAVLAGPLPGGPLPRAGDELASGLSAIDAGNPDRAYAHLTAVLTQCGASALGQQALLALAAAELDPRNGDPRRDLAAEAAAQVAARQPPDTWPGQVARTLYGVALRLGARPVPSVLPDAIELYGGSVAFDARPSRGAADCERTEAWPGPGLLDPAGPPPVRGASYPARIAALRQRVAELEQEMERLRRLTKP